MNKIYYLAIAIGLFGSATFAQAATFGTGDSYNLPADQTVDDDLYVAGGNTNIEGTVNGDLFVLTGNLKVSGTVKGGLFVAGGQVDLTGNVNGSVRIAGGNVLMNGVVGRDVLVSAGNIDLGTKGKINGQLVASGGQINVFGETGKIMANAGNLHIQNGANVKGDLIYSSQRDAQIDSGASISGKVEKHRANDDKKGVASKFGKAAMGVGTLISLIATILIAMLLNYLLPRQTRAMVEDWNNNYVQNLLWGVIYLVIVPVIAVFLLVTVIGAPLALILALIYALFVLLAKLVSVIVFGAWVNSLIRNDKALVISWSSVALGSVIMMVIGFIPVIGWLANTLIYVAALGVLVNLVWGKIERKPQIATVK